MVPCLLSPGVDCIAHGAKRIALSMQILFLLLYPSVIYSRFLAPYLIFLAICALLYALCALRDQHRIAITIEPVFSVDRLLIGIQDILSAGKSRYQH